MALVINTNVASLRTQGALGRTQHDLEVALQRLSSGLRINSARDDAAGLAISERFSAQIRGFDQAVRNSNDAISLAQTGDGAISEITDALQRIRELAVQSVNSTNSSVDRSALQTEVSELQAEIARVAATEFNEREIIGASATSYQFQVGPNAGDTITIITSNVLSGTSVSTVLSGTVSTAASASYLIDAVDNFLTSVNSIRATLGAVQSRFEIVVSNAENTAENLQAARSRIRDADFAKETAELTRAQILQQAGIAMLSQANALPESVLSLLNTS